MQISVLEYLERTAQACPDRTAFCDESGAFTFSQLRRAARGVGSALAALPGGVEEIGKVIGGLAQSPDAVRRRQGKYRHQNAAATIHMSVTLF